MSLSETYWKGWNSRLRCLSWLNLICMTTGIVYAACPQAWPGKGWFDTAVFILYLVTLLSNSLAVYVFHERSRLAAELFCLASVLGMLAMLFGNFSASTDYSLSGKGILQNRLIALIGISVAFGFRDLVFVPDSEAQRREADASDLADSGGRATGLINHQFFPGGGENIFRRKSSFIGAGWPFKEWSLFPCLHFSGQEGIWLVCLLNASAKLAWRRGLLGAGLATFILFMLPILLTPAIIINSERNFTETFHPPVFSSDDQRVFRDSRFDGMSYLLGVKPEKVRIIKNVEYYREETVYKRGGAPVLLMLLCRRVIRGACCRAKASVLISDSRRSLDVWRQGTSECFADG